MANFVVVDTDVLIDAGRGIREATSYLQHIEQQSTLAVSTITQMELIVGCRSKADLRSLDRFLSRFEVLKLTEHISAIARESARNEESARLSLH